MRVAFVNPLGLIGGAESILLDLMASLADAWPGVERDLILAAEDGPLADRATALGVRVHRLPLPEAIAGLGDSSLRGRGKGRAVLSLARSAVPAAMATRRYAGQLRALIREIGPDLIHSNGIKTHLLLRLAAPHGVPVAWHAHDFYGSRALMSRALRWASPGASHVLAISEAVGQDARALFPKVPVTVVYNAVDTEAFLPGPGDGPGLDALAGLAPADEGTVRVGLVATFARWKGQDLFLRALARMPREPGIRAFIVGGPIYKTQGSQFAADELRALAGSLGIAERVGFVPFQDDTAGVYRALDVVVHASTRPEPFGRTIVEAMACGRATIVARGGGAAELFAEDIDAVGFVPGDPEALAAAIRALVVDPARRGRLGAAARRSAVERFSRERLGREVAAVYRSMLPRPAGR